MIRFLLNDKAIETEALAGITLLDFIRYNKHLMGTKIGCREGDCGACTVLIGKIKEGELVYESMTSCITPLGNANGKHIVTIEGLNKNDLTPVQKAMVDESGTQCGFCTPGFVVSLSGYCLSNEKVSYENIISSIDGNICRCTGYKSIERAAAVIQNLLQNKDLSNPIQWAVTNQFIPEYFSTIKQELISLKTDLLKENENTDQSLNIGGGTDLYVQRHDDLHHASMNFLIDNPALKGISIKNNTCTIGGATTASELINSLELQSAFPNLKKHLKLISSTPIRNMGTIAGNFVNASPIGDLTAFFIALDSSITLQNIKKEERTIPLKDFYKGYKDIDKSSDELITCLQFTLPDKNTLFNFEKISKRTYLDIASVNSAIRIKTIKNSIVEISASAGGVGPTPLYLKNTCIFLQGKELCNSTINEALKVLQSEIHPISDARGTAEYKKLALKQLFLTHFLELYQLQNHF